MKKQRLSAVAVAAMLGVMLFPSSTVFAAENSWTEGNPLIAHALGEYEGKIETNSKEAFISSWESGYRVMEADFVYTSDNTLVVRHDFESGGSYYRLEIKPKGNLVMDSKTFKDTKIVYEQTPLTAAELLQLMDEYKDVYLVTDTKNTDKVTVQRQFRDLKKLAQNLGTPEVLDRIIPQIYSEEMLGWIKEIHQFPQWIYTLYQQPNVDYQRIAKFCAENNVGVVTMSTSRVTNAAIKALRAQGIQVYVHTINRYVQMSELLAMGVSGVYTDRIKPYELEWVGLSNERKIVEKKVQQGENTYTLSALDIMGTEYICLRDFANMMKAEGKAFSATYHPEENTLTMQSEGNVISLGNELLMQKNNRLITKKMDVKTTYDDEVVSAQGYTIDGEIYYPGETLAALTENEALVQESEKETAGGKAEEKQAEENEKTEEISDAVTEKETKVSAPQENTAESEDTIESGMGNLQEDVDSHL